MVLFWPIQQELDCINRDGSILGRIRFDGNKNEYVFNPVNDSISLSDAERESIITRLAGLASGKFTIPMQDDD